MRARCAGASRRWPSSSARVSSSAKGWLARSTKARLCCHSCHSPSAVASAVMPLPMPQRSAGPRRVTVRIGTLNVADQPSSPGRTTPSAPQYTPRAPGSSAWIIRMALTLGAPVTDPQGNNAANTSASEQAARVRASTSEVICHTVDSASVWNKRGTRTLNGSAMRDKSLRSRSTIITFSARSLADVRRASACAVSSSGVAPRGAVPFMGRVRMRPACQSKNSSGDTESTCSSPVSRYAA